MSAAATGPEPALAPPRAAAIAGVIFAVLFSMGLGLIRLAVPADPSEPGSWLSDSARGNALGVALNLVPFAGIAFLWFMGVLRNRLGALEDQFFATVFLGSGLLFVAMLFGAAATAGGLLQAITAGHVRVPDSEVYYAGRGMSYVLMNVFAIKMAGVFLMSTSTIGLKTAIFPRWVAYLGYGCALVLLVVITNWEWIALLFPLWILLLSVYILLADVRQGHKKSGTGESKGPASGEGPR
jgi:hypothetical protein